MKKSLIPLFIGFSVIVLLNGCVLAFNIGGGKKDSTSSTTCNATSNTATNCNNPHPLVNQETVAPTMGQQLIDLKKARDTGAITETEYEAEKAKLLNGK